MPTVSVNAPKTPVTKGSDAIAAATMPNVCKMPGPPAPFVPTPLPNIGKSGKAPQEGFSRSVTIDGHAVAIKGASFGSMGDIASKGLGGGIVSMNCEGPTSFIGPGSIDVKIEGKNVQLLGDQMLNNNGPSGSPSNTACMMGAVQPPLMVSDLFQKVACECDEEVQPDASDNCKSLGTKKHACCDRKLAKHREVQGEQGYNEKTGQPLSTPRMLPLGESFNAHTARIRGYIYPDAALLDDSGRPKQFIEFKFQCPKGVPTRTGASPSDGTSPQTWTPSRNGKPGQLQRTIALGNKLNPPTDPPRLARRARKPPETETRERRSKR